MRRCSLLAAMLIICLSATAFAQEEESYSHPSRSGFTVGAALGPGANITIPVNPNSLVTLETSTAFAMTTDFYIGGFLTPQWAIFLNTKVSWFSYADETYTASLSGLAFSYYFNSSYPSAVIGAGVGLALFDSVFVYTNSYGIGPGAYISAGYEFYKWLSVQATFLYSATFDHDLTWHNLTPAISLMFMWY